MCSCNTTGLILPLSLSVCVCVCVGTRTKQRSLNDSCILAEKMLDSLILPSATGFTFETDRTVIVTFRTIAFVSSSRTRSRNWDMNGCMRAQASLSAFLSVSAPVISLVWKSPEGGKSVEHASAARLWHSLCIMWKSQTLTAGVRMYGVCLSVCACVSYFVVS